MKRRKNLIIAFLLIASLALGIGYAAYTTTLTVNGTVGVSQEAIDFTNDVIFTNAVSDNTALGTADYSADVATFEALGMTKKGERVHFTYEISNNSDFDVTIAVSTTPITSAPDSKFTVTTTLASDTIAKGGKTTATVVVVLNEDVTTPLDPITYVTKYTAVSVDPAP